MTDQPLPPLPDEVEKAMILAVPYPGGTAGTLLRLSIRRAILEEREAFLRILFEAEKHPTADTWYRVLQQAQRAVQRLPLEPSP